MAVQSERNIASLDDMLAILQDLSCSQEINLGEIFQNFRTIYHSLTFNAIDGNQFAKVAMLLQSSATVYVRKVEFLYTLVVQMKELLKSKENQKDKGDKGSVEKVKKVLPLENAKNIELKEDSGKSKSIKLRPIVPVVLLNLDDIAKGDEFMFSYKGENIGYSKDYSLFSYQQSQNMMVFDHLPVDVVNAEHQQNGNMQSSNRLTTSPPVQQTLHNDDDGFDHMENHDVASDDGTIHNDHFDDAPNAFVRDISLRRPSVTNAPKCTVDPWATINPHDEVEKLVPKLKPGNRYKVPVKKVTRKRTRQKSVDLCPVADFISNAYYSHSAKLPKQGVIAPNCSSLESLFYEKYQARQKLTCNDGYQETGSSNGENSPLPYLPGIGINDGSDFDDVMDDDPFAENQDPFDMQPLGILSPIPNTNDGHLPSSPNDAVTVSYEELVRKHVENYLESAALYVQTTELTKRVREWEKKILPVLETEEKHEPYDIHVYGSKVLNNFNDSNRKETLTFQHIVQQTEPFEKARLLLATLQLANNYNVEISKTPESIDITLLSRKRHFEEVMEYDTHATHSRKSL